MRAFKITLIGMLLVVAPCATSRSWGGPPSASTDQTAATSNDQQSASSADPSQEASGDDKEALGRTPLRGYNRPYVVYPPIYRTNYGRPYYQRYNTTPFYNYGTAWGRGFPVGQGWINPNVGGGGFPVGGGVINPNVGN